MVGGPSPCRGRGPRKACRYRGWYSLLPNLPGDRKNVVLVLKDADHHAPAHLWCLLSARSCATTPFTSAIAIIGRMRQKIRKQVKKSPKLPNNVATSMLVGR